MEKINFQNNITKANAETMLQFQDNIENAINEVLNSVCPIGKVEIFFDNEDHSNYLGFTWERTSIGKVPVGIDTSDPDFDTIGKTGGEKTHTLTIDEMPEHNHGTAISGGTGDVYTIGSFLSGQSPLYYVPTNAVGGGKAHNNLQPFEVMAFWKRVA